MKKTPPASRTDTGTRLPFKELKESALRIKRRKKKNRRITQKLRTKVAARSNQAPPGTKQQIGNEERLLSIARRAVQLHGFEGKPYREIARQIQEEFKLTKLPSIPTLCRWMKLGKAEFLEDINDMRKQLRIEQFNECEEIKSRWRKAAYRHNIVKRSLVRDGKQIEETDENAFKEQAKAAEIFLKCCERQAKLLGLDLAGAEEKDGGKRQSPQDIYLWLTEMINADRKESGQTENTFCGLELCLDSGKEDPI